MNSLKILALGLLLIFTPSGQSSELISPHNNTVEQFIAAFTILRQRNEDQL